MVETKCYGYEKNGRNSIEPQNLVLNQHAVYCVEQNERVSQSNIDFSIRYAIGTCINKTKSEDEVKITTEEEALLEE